MLMWKNNADTEIKKAIWIGVLYFPWDLHDTMVPNYNSWFLCDVGSLFLDTREPPQ